MITLKVVLIIFSLSLIFSLFKKLRSTVGNVSALRPCGVRALSEDIEEEEEEKEEEHNMILDNLSVENEEKKVIYTCFTTDV